MEDAGRERFTCTWEGQRKTSRDLMRLKDQEQQTRGEKGSVGLGNGSIGSRMLLLNISLCEVMTIRYRVKSSFTEPIGLTSTKCSVTDFRIFSKLFSSLHAKSIIAPIHCILPADTVFVGGRMICSCVLWFHTQLHLFLLPTSPVKK